MTSLFWKLGQFASTCFKHEEHEEHEEHHGHGHEHEHEHGHGHRHAHDHRCEKGCSCCEIPETACPPRCVGRIKWKLGRGSVPEATILVRNVGLAARTFTFVATPLAGLDTGTASLSVLPASASLAPGHSQLLHVKLLNSATLRPSQDYHAEILVRGAWEQSIAVFCHVVRDPFETLRMEQSDSFAEKAFHPPTVKTAIRWEIDRGVVPQAAISVYNLGKSSCTFNFEATPLLGPDHPTATVVLTPSSMQLGPGQNTVVRVKLQDSLTLTAGQAYDSDIVIHGFYQQRIELCTYVEPDASGYVEVEQGEAPTHRRAHHWYDHFQCTDACRPAL